MSIKRKSSSHSGPSVIPLQSLLAISWVSLQPTECFHLKKNILLKLQKTFFCNGITLQLFQKGLLFFSTVHSIWPAPLIFCLLFSGGWVTLSCFPRLSHYFIYPLSSGQAIGTLSTATIPWTWGRSSWPAVCPLQRSPGKLLCTIPDSSVEK